MNRHVIQAEYIDDYRIWLRFENGISGEVDLSDSMEGPIFAPLADAEYFKRFTLGGNTLSWPNGADFAPEYLYAITIINRNV